MYSEKCKSRINHRFAFKQTSSANGDIMNFPHELWANRFVFGTGVQICICKLLEVKIKYDSRPLICSRRRNPNQSPSIYVYSLSIFQNESIRLKYFQFPFEKKLDPLFPLDMLRDKATKQYKKNISSLHRELFRRYKTFQLRKQDCKRTCAPNIGNKELAVL